MSIDSIITDPRTGRQALLTDGGALAVSPVRPSVTFNATLGTDDTAVNIVPAKADHVFFMTGLSLTANQNVSNTVSATVSIYVGGAEDTAVGSALTTLVAIPLGRNDTRDIFPIFVQSPPGKWINGETSDDDIFVTIFGYYLKEE